jgi:hypothetical protein
MSAGSTTPQRGQHFARELQVELVVSIVNTFWTAPKSANTELPKPVESPFIVQFDSLVTYKITEFSLQVVRCSVSDLHLS